MADREKVIKEFEHLLNAANGNYQDFVDLTVDGGKEILSLLKEQPEVVRCKDCRHWRPDKFNVRGIFLPSSCEYNSGTWAEDSYCSNAERR